jgi:Rps23 Pro-64 3,4-dihydroxylase Tpa1-like proline 4-hydroxylase
LNTGRRIAYILYLVSEDWSAEDGGALDLFSSESGNPTKVAKSIVPSRNAFAFFEVTPASFHQVRVL